MTIVKQLIAIRRYDDGIKALEDFIYEIGEGFMIEEAEGLEAGQAEGRSYNVGHRELCEYYRRMPEQCSPSAPLRQIEGLHGGRISGSS